MTPLHSLIGLLWLVGIFVRITVRETWRGVRR